MNPHDVRFPGAVHLQHDAVAGEQGQLLCKGPRGLEHIPATGGKGGGGGTVNGVRGSHRL
jgi:hypothetical protein